MTYSLMAKDLGGTETMSLAMLQAIDVRGLFDLKKWNRMKDSLMLCPGIGLEIGCLHLKSTGLKVAFMEDWAHIVHAAHCPLTHDNHLGVAATPKAVQKEWCTDKRQHGLPLDYIKDSIHACGCLLKEKIIYCDVAAMPISSRTANCPTSSIETTTSQVEQQLTRIMIKHHTRLVLVRSSKRHRAYKWLQEYICHRGGSIDRRGADKRRQRKSKRCGCLFRLVVQHCHDGDRVTITIHGNHTGHIPSSRADLYHLPVHSTVVAYCMDDLFDVGMCRHVAKMSISKERFHMANASELDRVIYRFFMIPKEVQMLL
ncbi:hypothetical protein GOP47_0021409 [Adiantum capillus-veneris]|uniref:Uncharacterized protein n=1 Tax=Adiantum capillus-veneris TaxID=13818 RepID=A0A9D4U8A6_ADICA|nr:hypothetical protein GOP47_0021409 [Adiantum capillus-veneris]